LDELIGLVPRRTEYRIMYSSDISYVMKDTKMEGTMRNEGIDADKKA